MANIFAVTVLQINQYAQPTNGTVFALPSAGIVVSPANAVVDVVPEVVPTVVPDVVPELQIVHDVVVIVNA